MEVIGSIAAFLVAMIVSISLTAMVVWAIWPLIFEDVMEEEQKEKELSGARNLMGIPTQDAVAATNMDRVNPKSDTSPARIKGASRKK